MAFAVAVWWYICLYLLVGYFGLFACSGFVVLVVAVRGFLSHVFGFAVWFGVLGCFALPGVCDFRWFLLWVLGWLFSGADLTCGFLV